MTLDYRRVPISRRRFLGATATLGAILGCNSDFADLPDAGDGRIHFTPHAPTSSIAAGDYPLSLDAPRDGRLYIPPNYDALVPAPLMVGLHGAGGSGANWLQAMKPAADAMGVVIVAPDSRGRTWDAIGGEFNEDVTYIEHALAATFARVNVDASRVALAGFSDGATYALSLGLANGDIFSSVIAMSPGFVVAAPHNGHPRFFIEHGTSDTVLPVDQCSRQIVPSLRNAGYDVTYTEFEGGHEIRIDERDNAFAWFVAGPAV